VGQLRVQDFSALFVRGSASTPKNPAALDLISVTSTKRGIALFLVLALVLPLGPAVGVRTPGMVPLNGGSATAPQQESASPDGIRAPDTSAQAGSAPRSTGRSPGAVADRLDVPAVQRREPDRGKLTDIAVRASGTPKTGYDAETSVEDDSQRAANSKVFRNADGTRTRRLFDAPVHVRRLDGTWAPVDLELIASDGRVVPRLAPFEVSFGTRASDMTRLNGIGFRPLEVVPAAARLSGAQVTYPEVWPDVDLRLKLTSTGVKQDLVLGSAGRTAFDFELRTEFRPSLDPVTGDVHLLAGDEVRAVIPAGWMRDARGIESRAVRYQLTPTGEAWLLRTTVDEAWLRAPDRAFPVVVDPSTTINADLDDTYVTSGAPANRSGEIQLKAGKEGNGRISAAYLHFSGLAGVLRNQYVIGASLVLFNAGSASCTPKPVDVFEVGGPWTGVTLTSWPGAPLGRHLAQRTFAHGAPGCTAGAFEAFPLPPDVVTDWTHGAPFHGLSVRSAAEGDSGAFKRFGAADAGNNAAPYLDVTYAPHGASYRVNEVLLPTAGHEGRLKATVRNRGSVAWTPSGSHRFGFVVKQGGTLVQTSPKFAIPHDVPPQGEVALDVPIRPVVPGDYQVFMTMYDGESDYQPTYGVPYGVFDMRVENVPPSVNVQQPGSGASIDSLTPTVYAEGTDTDNWPGKGLQFNFKLCDGPPDAPVDCVESGWTNATWSPPVGRLRWSRTYYWWVQAHDTVGAGPFAGPLVLTTQVPQPEITSHLGGTPQGAPAPGLDPQVGNFGTATTDADIATVGPDLTITRTYNSLDPRTNTAFGQGWASRVDTSLEEDADGSGNVVVTLPSGRQVRFGRNHDGTYAPPLGQNLTLVLDSATGYYTLRDATGRSWQFNPWGRLRTITDPNGLVEELEYDVAGPAGTAHSIFNHTSKRRLHLTWSSGRVTRVRTDAPTPGASPLEWTYSFDGARLTNACDPGGACTRYDYQAGSHYRSVVLDDNPRAYYRFGDASTRDGAASATARKPGADKGLYVGVGLGPAGPLPQPPAGQPADQAAEFDGAASRVDLPEKLISPTMTLAVELWFRTTSGGVLISYENEPRNLYTPVLYVGQDGHLRGGFWVPQPSGARQISSAGAVNDGAWHHVVLSASVNSQTLYVDGVAQPGTVTGVIDHDDMPRLMLGKGKTVGWPSGNNSDYFFAGGIDEVALYQHPLGATAVAQHYAARAEVVQLTRITLPQNDRVAASLTYDYLNDRVATYTDHDGRAWRLDNALRDEAVRTVILHGPYPDWVYEFDADHGGRPASRSHNGRTRRFAYNTSGFQSEEVDELGHKVTFTTDARGNVLSRTTCRVVGSCQTSYSTYFGSSAPLDPRNDRKLSDSDARSAGPDDTTYRTSYTYDSLGRLVSTTYPKPAGVSSNPVETWRYSLGTEPADGGGDTPAGLLVEHTGKRTGQVTRYSYRSNGDLAVRVDPRGLQTRCTYDALGRKTSEATQFGTTSFGYTARSQLETVTTPVVRNTLSGADHRLVTRYLYDLNGNNTQITMSDTAGADPPRVTAHEYNEHDHLIATTFPDGSRETRSYRSAGQETSVTDARGTTWTTYTDSQNRVLRRTASGPGVDPADSSSSLLVLETHAYDAAGRLAASRDAMGRETRHTYYDDDLPATATHSGVLVSASEYDPAGNVVKLTTAGGRVSETSYDAAGFETSIVIDPSGLRRSTTYVRDADGLPRSVSLTGAASPGRVETSTFGYNTAGDVIRSEAANTVVTYLRDERGLVVQEADRRRLTTDSTYDVFGRLVTSTGPAVDTWSGGQLRSGVRPIVTYGHNTFGDVTDQRDPNGALTVVTHDTRGRVTSLRLPDYVQPDSTTIRAVTRTDYDSLGNPVRSTDPLGRVTERVYDPHGRVTALKAPRVDDQPNVTHFGYSRAGEQISVTDPSGATRLSTYDDRGRRITDTAVERLPSPTYFTTQYGYDDASNPVSTTTPGSSVTRTSFNAAGEPVTVTDPTGRTTSYGYDLAGRQVSAVDPAGLTTVTTYDLLGRAVATAEVAGGAEQRRWTRSYDPNGNLLGIASPEGRLRSFTYDAANRLVRQEERVDASRTIRTSFGYDAVGNRTRFVDGNGNVVTYGHSPWGLPESVVEADATWTSVYDAAGQLIRSVAPGNVVAASEYDAQGRVTRQAGSGAESATTDRTFGYSPSGHLTRFDGNSVSYDDRGNILTFGSAAYTYTADNQVATRADASGNASFLYDPAGRVMSVVDSLSARTLDYAYDPAGRLASSSERGMSQYLKRVNAYDSLGRVTSDRVTESDPSGGPPRVILGTEYGYDRDDNITSKTSIANDQRVPNVYGYDGAGLLTSFNGTTYAWDDAGNRTRAGSATFTYNSRNQLTSDGTNSYTYTARGTLASAGARTPKFDAFDQLVEDSGVSFSYDSLGRVARRGSIAFAYGGLANDVVSDGTRLISRGVDGQPLSDGPVGASLPGKLLYADLHGDVVGRYRGLSSFGQRTFDPFGVVTGSSGEQSGLGFQGEWTEPGTGAVNMHSRWYSPGTGTFASRDTWTIDPTPSVAANRYGYGNANPLSNVDPSGHLACVKEVAVSVGTGAALGAVAGGGGAAPGALVGGIRGGAVCAVYLWSRVLNQGVGRLSGGFRIPRRPSGKASPPLTGTAVDNALLDAENAAKQGNGKNRSGPGPGPGPGGGPGGGGGGSVAPPPPPPPAWLLAILRAEQRTVAGGTVLERPNAVDADSEQSVVVDPTQKYAEEANEITKELEGAGLQQAEIARVSEEVNRKTKERDDCLSGSGRSPTPPNYWAPAGSKSTGADACMNHANDKDGTGTSARFGIDPPGYQTGVDNRGHLIAKRFGGDGTDLANLVAITRSTNNEGMKSDFESCVGRRMELVPDERIFYVSVPVYGSGGRVDGVVMLSVGNRGYHRSKYIKNVPVYRPGPLGYCT
jgi:RHS repeat-associated protein